MMLIPTNNKVKLSEAQVQQQQVDVDETVRKCRGQVVSTITSVRIDLHQQFDRVTMKTVPALFLLLAPLLTSCSELYRPVDCSDIRQQDNSSPSGVYTLYPLGERSAVQVYCDMDSSGGGWTVFQRRMDGTVNFYRPWDYYKFGFGDPAGEYWLGLDNIYYLTNQRKYEYGYKLQVSGFSDGGAGLHAIKSAKLRAAAQHGHSPTLHPREGQTAESRFSSGRPDQQTLFHLYGTHMQPEAAHLGTKLLIETVDLYLPFLWAELKSSSIINHWLRPVCLLSVE
ncbi:angiopoietin-2-like, partial [Anabas testudineus]|uniref:angiopoietin-2-like n=1 Tax=Anabas testudineus TaxID=64144 RepID=UPI000E45D5A8